MLLEKIPLEKVVTVAETPQPTYVDLWDAFVCGAREARMNPTADEKAFNRAADGYCKLVHSHKDPAMFASLGGGGGFSVEPSAAEKEPNRVLNEPGSEK